MAHDNLKPPYPQASEFQEGLKVLINYVRGIDGHSFQCAVHAGWVCAGYSCSFIPDAPPPIIGEAESLESMTIMQLADLLSSVTLTSKSDSASIPWRSLLILVMEILSRIIKER